MSEMSPRKQRLPKHLGTRLPARTRHALQHPFRRQILRVLHRDVQKLSASELVASGLMPCSASTASYHMRVLHKARLIKKAGSKPVGNSVKQYFSSLIGDKSPVLRVLRDTEQSDDQLFAHTAAK